MLEIIIIFSTSFIVGFSGAMMPGPLTALTITESARQGFWAAPLLILGHVLAELLVVVALTMGLGRAFRKSAVAGLIGLLGGAVLLWMGSDILRGVLQGTVSLDLASSQQASSANPRLIVAGVVASASNPYWFLWWATIGMSYVTLYLKRGTPGLGAFYTGHGLADLTWNGFLGFMIVSGKRIISQDVYSGLLLVCGLALVILSLYFIYTGVNFLRGRAIAPVPEGAS